MFGMKNMQPGPFEAEPKGCFCVFSLALRGLALHLGGSTSCRGSCWLRAQDLLAGRTRTH